MTIDRMIELLKIEHECMLRNSHGDCNRRCEDCDLVQDDEELHEMYTDVIGVLKAQEPRVMTLEEIEALGDDGVVYLECRYIVDGIAEVKPAIFQPDNSSPEEDGYYCVVSSWGKSGFYHTDDYNADWRCWTSRPSDEVRRATPWN